MLRLADIVKRYPVWGGMKDGMNDLVSVNNSIPEAAKKLVAQKKVELQSGKLHVFAGPIRGPKR